MNTDAMNTDAMNTDATPDSQTESAERRWQPLSSIQRRVIGVLVEKAKTTPDAYPLTLNALTNGCNQKSNRSPQMSLTTDDIQQALDDLRELGAVVEIQSGGRVPKYRHYMYEWLGVDKVELAIMADFFLRGPQTAGAMRGHAARMEPIPDLDALQPRLDSLIQKQLVVPLTPSGRGQVFAHALYRDKEMAELKQQAEAGQMAAPSPAVRSRVSADEFAELKAEVAELKAEVAELKAEVPELKAEVPELKAEVPELKAEVAQLRAELAQLTQLVQSMTN